MQRGLFNSIGRRLLVDPSHQATTPSLLKKIDVAQKLKVMDIEKEIQCPREQGRTTTSILHFVVSTNVFLGIVIKLTNMLQNNLNIFISLKVA
jgi:hypothetical protein